jgi:hypothetical protein
MTQWERAHRWSMGLFVVGISGALVACGSPGGEGCGGIEDIVSCVTVTEIVPMDSAGTNTSNVDAFPNPDCNGDGTQDDPETFTDHSAAITFSNQPFPKATDSLPVTIRHMAITYSINNCPAGAFCPPLPDVSQNVTLVIEAENTTTATFPLVPLRVKDAYFAGAGGVPPSAPPSYNANYTFTAQTQGFTDTFQIEASQEFTIGDFDLCP